MHRIFELGNKVWSWLLANNASRATVILVFITALYAFLTWRMAKAIARQTRAIIQPVASLEFFFDQKRFHPTGHFEIKNLGTQPLLLLDVKLWCGIHHGKDFTQHYELWDEHILPPGLSLRPLFDFKSKFERDNLSWSSDWLSYSLEVVASDLSKQIILTYRNIPVLNVVNVSKGMPLSVRWRYFLKPFAHQYIR